MSLTRLVLVATLALSFVGVFPAVAAAKDRTVICPDGSNGYSFPAGTVVKGDLVVPAGLYCSPLEVTLKGDVRIESNATSSSSFVADLGTEIKGDVSVASGATNVHSVVLQTTQIGGSVQLQNVNDIVNLVGPVIKGDVTVTNSNIVVLANSEVNGDVTLTGNQFVLITESVIHGSLSCEGNATVSFISESTTVDGDVLGQCASA
jgi:hypothetical protein